MMLLKEIVKIILILITCHHGMITPKCLKFANNFWNRSATVTAWAQRKPKHHQPGTRLRILLLFVILRTMSS